MSIATFLWDPYSICHLRLGSKFGDIRKMAFSLDLRGVGNGHEKCACFWVGRLLSIKSAIKTVFRQTCWTKRPSFPNDFAGNHFFITHAV